jgi:hypothetical protein
MVLAGTAMRCKNRIGDEREGGELTLVAAPCLKRVLEIFDNIAIKLIMFEQLLLINTRDG